MDDEYLKHVQEKIRTDRKWAERALKALYRCQTVEEQNTEETIERNGVGFNANDAPFLSSLAQSLEHYPHLTERQLKAAQKLLPKYARQLLDMQKGNPE